MERILTCAHFFDGAELHGPSEICLDDGVITHIQPCSRDTEFFLVAPGFVDLQVNGFREIDVSLASHEELIHLDKALRDVGTTHWLATVISAPLASMSRSIEVITDAMRGGLIPGCLGVHLEGPFLGGAAGAHQPERIIPFDPEWVQSLPDVVRLMTIAPEQNISQYMPLLKSQNIVVSIGHTRASREQFDHAVNAGAHLVTHLFNGMSGVHHRDEGVALWALMSNSVSVGVIADLVHVSAQTLALTFRTKGSDRVILVSDSIGWDHPRAVERMIYVREGAPRLPNGTIAGSCTPLATCVRNCVESAGIPLFDAFQSATSTPLRALGISHSPRVRVNTHADLNVFDAELHVVETLCRLPFIRG